MKRSLIPLLLLSRCTVAMAAQPVVWPPGWDVQPMPVAPGSGLERQRAVKADGNGDPEMVVELSRAAVEPGHVVNIEAVLLQMRKSAQAALARQGYQSACTSLKGGTLGGLSSAQSTCEVTLNGGHVLTQTLVAASGGGMAWSLSYAGTVAGYRAHQAEVDAIRNALVLDSTP